MEHRLRRCPNCLSEIFFVEQSSGLVFLNVRENGTMQGSKPPHAILDLAVEDIFCTSCGWHGVPGELLPPKDD